MRSPNIYNDQCALYNVFITYSQSQQQNFYNSLATFDTKTTQVILDDMEWSNEASTMLEKLGGTNVTSYCLDTNVHCLSLFSLPFSDQMTIIRLLL